MVSHYTCRPACSYTATCDNHCIARSLSADNPHANSPPLMMVGGRFTHLLNNNNNNNNNNHHYHRRHPGNNIPFTTHCHGSPKRKCGLFPQHHGQRVNCRCNHNFACLSNFSCLRLCAGGLSGCPRSSRHGL